MPDFHITRYLPAIIAWLLLIFASSVFYYFLIPFLINVYGIYGLIIAVGECALVLMVVSNFYLATVMDPGSLPRDHHTDDQQDDFRMPLYKNIEINDLNVRLKWCVTCQFYRPPRCSHCSVCDKCIENFDHHCPWVNNCIGRRNYRHFLFFLLTLALHILAVFAVCLLHVLNHRHDLLKLENLVSFAIMGLCGLLFVPIIGLAGFHIILVIRARTTNEQVTGKFRGGHNPFTVGCCSNTCNTICSPVYPRFDNYVGLQAKLMAQQEQDYKKLSSFNCQKNGPKLKNGVVAFGKKDRQNDQDQEMIQLPLNLQKKSQKREKTKDDHISANDTRLLLDTSGNTTGEQTRLWKGDVSSNRELPDDDSWSFMDGESLSSLKKRQQLFLGRSTTTHETASSFSRHNLFNDGSKCNLLLIKSTDNDSSANNHKSHHHHHHHHIPLNSHSHATYDACLKEAYASTTLHDQSHVGHDKGDDGMVENKLKIIDNESPCSSSGLVWHASKSRSMDLLDEAGVFTASKYHGGGGGVSSSSYPVSMTSSSVIQHNNDDHTEMSNLSQAPPNYSIPPNRRPMTFTQAVQLHDRLADHQELESSVVFDPNLTTGHTVDSQQQRQISTERPKTKFKNEIRV